MYEPSKLEKKIEKYWEKNNTYEKIKEANAKGDKFYFNDGPPYATGQIHPGTAWNKGLKDAVCRYKRARGFNVRAQPGFDTHGLPIEVKVEQELKLTSKKDIEEKVGVEEFIEKCKEFATKYIGVMGKQFRSIGVWMDWENPYITYKDPFIEKSWLTVKKADEKGLLEKGERVLPFCPRCETTLANYELEYGDRTDPSIYVKFRLEGKENEYLIVWTTTPWTLVANMAVMAHPEYTYVKAKVGDEYWILAKERLDAVSAIADPLGSKRDIVEEFSGRKLKDVKYVHPLLEEVPMQQEFAKDYHFVTLSDEFVTLEEGTGLVHTAPGHGPADFEIGKRDGIPAFCPINLKGDYTQKAGPLFEGKFVTDANPLVIERLDMKGILVNSGKITHRYAHCWRCKSPLLYGVTDQWFIKISQIRDKMIAEIDTCKWQPDFARVWFKDFVSNAPDWCVSRQRYWGIPIPVWVCSGKDCSERKVIASRKELEELSGKKVKELHKPYIDKVVFKCDKCGGKMHRVKDVLDVWFDSGNAIWASLDDKEMKAFFPCDFIVEGKDQIRGWFYSLLGSGVVSYDEIPYKSLLMHGFFVDEKGEKMSKSLGNFVPLEEIVGKYGADTFRLWSLNSVIWEDLKFNWDEVKDANRTLGILWNTHVYLERLMEAEGFDPEKNDYSYDLEDKWLRSRLNSLVQSVTKSYDEYAVHEANRVIRRFVVEDLSRFYLKLGKKRLNEGRNKEAVVKTLYDSLLVVSKLLTPIAPFVCEQVWQNVFAGREGVESVSLAGWPEADAGLVDAMLEKNMALASEISSSLANARQAANVKLRWPLEEAVIATESTEVRNAVEHLPFVIEMLSNVKRIRITDDAPLELSFKVNFNELGKVFKKEAKAVEAELSKVDAKKLRKELNDESKPFKLKASGKEFEITPHMVVFDEDAPKGYSYAEFSGGKLLLKTTVSEGLYAEAMARELSRRAQIMRKDLGLVESDRVLLNIIGEGKLAELAEKQKQEIAKQVRADEVIVSGSQELEGKSKEWDVEGEKIVLVVKKV